MNTKRIDFEDITKTSRDIDFSGTVMVKNKDRLVFEHARDYANRSEELQNNIDTRFGIASGCKLFTAIAIAQLVDKGVLSFQTRIKECLNIDFPHFDEKVTIHHLLTHTSGIPDYFDEEVMDDFADLWKEQPMYLLNDLDDFLPMFQHQQMMFHPGEKFHYNNAGFIVLGLIVEQKTGLRFTDYVEKNIFTRCGMKASGYFSLDQLPKNTTYGYIKNEEDDTWKTNIYSIPLKGGADGGAFVTASDMMKLWEALFNGDLLSKETTDQLLHPYNLVKDEVYYGYGLWINKRNGGIFKYHIMGYDPGVSFHSAVYPTLGMKVVVLSNKGDGAYQVNKAIEESFPM